jgi:hypothetical protein
MDRMKHTEQIMDWMQMTLAADRASASWETDHLGKKDPLTLTTRKLISALTEGLWALHVESEWPHVDIWQPKRMLAENKSRPLWPPDDDPFGAQPNSTTFSSS